jgi:hypothetical protein
MHWPVNRIPIVAWAFCFGGQLSAQAYVHRHTIHDTTVTATGAKLGWTMALSGDRLALGSPHFDAQHGRISVVSISAFDPPLTWVQESDPYNAGADSPVQQRFGASLAMGGEWVMVGNCSPFGTTQYCNTSAQWVTAYTPVGDTWQAYPRITAPAAVSGGVFGKAIAVEGEWCVIGGARSGSVATARDVVYLFRFVGGLWQLKDSLWGDQNETGSAEAFGHALALSDGVLAVGSSGDDELGTDGGAVFLYARDENEGGNWVLLRKLLPSIGNAGDRFGTAVALQDSRCVVGSPERLRDADAVGAAYVFGRDEGFPGNWGEAGYLEPIGDVAAGMDHGASVAIGPDRIAVGAPLHDRSPQGTDGTVHVYQRLGGNWVGVQRIVPYEDGVTSAVARAGTSLSFHGERLLIGAPFAIIPGLTPPATGPTGGVLVYAQEPVSVQEHSNDTLTIWPNPFSERISVSFTGPGQAPLRVIDPQGRVVRELAPLVPGINTWDLGDLRAGPYYLQLDLPNGIRVSRPVIRY